ncbi:uncharacterized protein LOC107863871 [Capsicum annuum]|uniref:uncharacterized protein LOC107863871 n=1 Tax=Capsicum annuum TaxID=4072 RepID=UPI001FB19454|nr:uncharacterized protein LOC107863871 [Capsicum annuum]
MSLKSAKAIWDYFKTEYAGNERIRGMQVLNLIRDELQRMKESESIKEHPDRLLSIANKVRLLETELTDSRIVEKLLVTVPERQAMRRYGVVEGALPAKHQDNNKNLRKNFKNQSENGESSFNNNKKGKGGGSKKIFPPCQHCGKKGHPPFKYWRRPD